jgi:hypothetical protein
MATSARKRRANRRNGKLGGRPRKSDAEARLTGDPRRQPEAPAPKRRPILAYDPVEVARQRRWELYNLACRARFIEREHGRERALADWRSFSIREYADYRDVTKPPELG